MTPALDRAQLLMQQNRPALAEQELRQHLTEAPNDARAHAVLALVLSQQDKAADAIAAAEQAIALAPDFALPHYAHGVALLDANQPKPAEAAAKEALRLDREDPDAFALLAAIYLRRERWEEALAATEDALHLDAEHVWANNLRAIALVQLGRRDEAGQTLDATLHRDPNNATAHANLGWKLLHDNKPREASEHFREALRLEPNHEWARSGILEALKARNPLYRLMLRYFLWMSRLDGRARWGIIIGLVLVINILPAGFTIPYLLFVLLTWVADPLFNLLLRLDPFGRYVLNEDEIKGANAIGVCLLAAVAALIAGVVMGEGVAYWVALGAVGLMLPVAGTFARKTPSKRYALGGYTLVLIACLAAWAAGSVQNPEAAWVPVAGSAFVFGLVLFTWAGNLIAD